MDLVTTTKRFPNRGETLLGDDFQTIPGGKGANQAVAAAKLGADVSFVGCVGDDAFGDTLIKKLKSQGIFTGNVEPVTDVPTGIASITVAEGDNTIVVVPGANDHVTPEVICQNEETIKNSDVLLLQFEIPIESVTEAIRLANKHGVKTVLNPAPVRSIELSLLEKVDYITPNEHELNVMLDTEEKKEFYQQYREKFIVTQGAKGVVYVNGNQEVNVKGYQVNVVDTTGAGDTFNGGFSVALAEGKSVEEACTLGNVAGAISVTQFGAQTGMPTRKEVNKFLESDGD